MLPTLPVGMSELDLDFRGAAGLEEADELSKLPLFGSRRGDSHLLRSRRGDPRTDHLRTKLFRCPALGLVSFFVGDDVWLGLVTARGLHEDCVTRVHHPKPIIPRAESAGVSECAISARDPFRLAPVLAGGAAAVAGVRGSGVDTYKDAVVTGFAGNEGMALATARLELDEASVEHLAVGDGRRVATVEFHFGELPATALLAERDDSAEIIIGRNTNTKNNSPLRRRVGLHLVSSPLPLSLQNARLGFARSPTRR